MSGNQANKQSLIVQNQKQFATLLDKMKSQLALALPAHMSADRMARIALTEFRKTPLLAECDPMSVCAAVMVSAGLGLEIGVLGQAYLVPYRNHKKGIVECQLIPGYRGFIDLARRSGQIISISAHIVYSNDAFEIEYGLEDKLLHKPAMVNAGEMVAAYAVAKLVGGGHQFLVMSKEKIDEVKNKAKAQSGPWVSDYEEMAKKTVVRRLFKWLPSSVEMQKAALLDEHSDAGIQDVKSMLVEDVKPEAVDIVAEYWAESENVDKETGEIKSQADELAAKL